MLPDLCRHCSSVELLIIVKQEIEECFNPNKMIIVILFAFDYSRKRFGLTSADPQIQGI